METKTNYQSVTLFILRLVLASLFYVAAYFKFSFWSTVPAGVSPFLLFTTRLLSIAEPLGATALVIGFLTRLTASCLIIVLIGAIIVSQYVYGIGFTTPTSPGWNFPLTALAGCLILTSFGGGRYSVDFARGRK